MPAILTVTGLVITVLAQRIFAPSSVLRLVFLFVAFVIFAVSLVLLIQFWVKKYFSKK
ncbi:MAG: hypothetical protein LBS01_00165 [Prevotellaceae bacterium]|nr:hypothetical protein [Prevotellaceae bacterium]